MRKFNYKRLIVMLVVVLAMTCLMATTAFAAGTGDVAGAVESTWSTASTHIKSVVDNVVFPAIDRSEERRVGKECRSRWSPYH